MSLSENLEESYLYEKKAGYVDNQLPTETEQNNQKNVCCNYLK